jgi:hypothetical protein
MFSVTSLDDPVDIECAPLDLSIIDLLKELEHVEERVEATLVGHHEREEAGVLCLGLYRHLLREDVLEVLVGLGARAEHVEEDLGVQVELLICLDLGQESLRV